MEAVARGRCGIPQAPRLAGRCRQERGRHRAGRGKCHECPKPYGCGPFVLGVLMFLWATGLAVIRTGTLPMWLGYVMILLGVVALTPIGWAAAIGTAILVLALSILLSARAYSRTSERIDRVTA